jgi:hypothetical protein
VHRTLVGDVVLAIDTLYLVTVTFQVGYEVLTNEAP